MQTAKYEQRLYYLSETDVRDAIFHWLATVHQVSRNAGENMSTTAGRYTPITIQILKTIEKD